MGFEWGHSVSVIMGKTTRDLFDLGLSLSSPLTHSVVAAVWALGGFSLQH